ncbi:hypothetical protein [Hydrogenophaga sp. BPS33]|uniref:hypothetical protein n=1 Tax=Hydrogenophaga sp. BPS33 TaxID=2651974 RepID=UPI00131F96A0|nr:hypothetical protein [Hydrogenophaga sp. BPS33]QHE87788.1 hypothetical protein F9K07_24275 [Hydrogenophaga sp. BPS33]
MDASRDDIPHQIAAVAARLVVDEGLEYAAAKRRAVKQLGLPARTALPDNMLLDAAVREDIAVFCPDTQAAELQTLRELALVWMDRLQAFRPHLGGAVWHGMATRHSDIYLQLFCDDPKAPEWALLDHRVEYHPGTVNGWRGEPVQALTLRVRCEALGQWVLVHLMVHDLDDLRGALKPDAQGRKPRGDAAALRRLMAGEVSA